MKNRELRTVDEVIDAIGGKRLQQITGRRSANITNWRERGRFPPHTFFVMTSELKRKRLCAPLKLWSQIEPAAIDRAA
jgi:hypothetical protein